MDCMKRSGGLKRIFCTLIVAVVFIAAPLPAQVVPSAFGPARSLWAGAEYSNLHAGFPYQSDQRLWGIGVFSDYHLNTRIDVEAEARFLRFNSFYGESEDNYLAGPRYLAGTFRRFQPYAQFLVGLAEMRYPFKIGSRQYFALAPGGGVNYRVGRRWTARAEYEYQLWPGSPDYSNEPAHEITPNGFHIGLAYRLLR
ncbi:MAG TPA: outer membrane beta-barrel protein [Terracidiphilus sp.]|nr:outer membrane beta-barrel protein [Terracidiphilus sp.]